MEQVTINTTKQTQIIDVTEHARNAVRKSGVREGFCLVYMPHATAAIIINEHEPNLERDFLRFFSEFVPKGNYEHNKIDDNAEAHMKSAFFHAGKVLPVSGGELALGTWQRVLLCEFDGPRARRLCILVK